MSGKIAKPDCGRIVLGLSEHRPELVPFFAAEMACSDVIFLEEPGTPGFRQMLNGSLSIDDYLQQVDVEFPVFSRSMCGLLQDLHRQGKEIVQVEPFLEFLQGIHDFFADGNRPGDIRKNTAQSAVYDAERNATTALIGYYRAASGGSFEQTLDAVRRFARSDAARFRLRDGMRARVLAALVPSSGSVYIEAGSIHYLMWRQLRRLLTCPEYLRVVFWDDMALREAGKKGHLYGPGDLLTLLYIFHPGFSNPERETLLAARSIVHAKVSAKEESERGDVSLQPIVDERHLIETIGELSMNDCRQLFPIIRTLDTRQARSLVLDYLDSESHHRSGASTPAPGELGVNS